MQREFDAAITTYREAERLCQTLSGNALHAAQDEEAEALDDLARTPGDSLGLEGFLAQRIATTVFHQESRAGRNSRAQHQKPGRGQQVACRAD